METNAKITLDNLRKWIKEENPAAKIGDVEQYSHQLLTYFEASLSVLVLGAIVAHPRTAAPMENPHLKQRNQSMSAMQKLKKIRKTDETWAKIQAALDEAINNAKPS
jgi:hypothetical protein